MLVLFKNPKNSQVCDVRLRHGRVDKMIPDQSSTALDERLIAIVRLMAREAAAEWLVQTVNGVEDAL